MTVLELINWLNLHAEHEAEVFILGRVQAGDVTYDIEIGEEHAPFTLKLDEESADVLIVMPKVNLNPKRFR